MQRATAPLQSLTATSIANHDGNFKYSYKTKGEQILMLPSRQEFARFFGALETDKDTPTIPYR